MQRRRNSSALVMELSFLHQAMNVVLTHWGRVTHICVGKLTIIGSDNGLSPQRRQTIIWTNAGMLLIGTLGTNFSEILIEIQRFSLKKILLKTSSAKWRPSCLGLNELRTPSPQRVCLICFKTEWWDLPFEMFFFYDNGCHMYTD